MPGATPEAASETAMLRPLGSTGLRCFPLGFGCYRVADGNAAHELALRAYLQRGGNLIDTSANYGDGRSEVLVGKVLRDFPRQRVILVTKGGYIQGQNMELAQRRRFPEVVEYGQGLWHSIHPEFLDTQLLLSAERMQQPFIDVYLLHNPEYYLEHESHGKKIGKTEHDEFYRRVKEAFRLLESKVSEGKIGWYGISSNNFGMSASRPTMTSIERCWEAAESLSTNHHFRVVQLPMNLYEVGGALEANNSGKTALDFCRAHGIGVLLNRPLNAFFQNRMVRLADFVPPGEPPPGEERLRALLAPIAALEAALEQQMEVPLIYGDGKGVASYLEVMVPQVRSLAHWEEVFGEYVIQPIQQWATQCHQLYGDKEEWKSWWREFATKLTEVFEGLTRYIAASGQSLSNAIRSHLQLAGYPETTEPLSRMALNVLLRLEGVSSALNGMRHPSYVEDSLGALASPPVNALDILRNFSRIQPQQPMGITVQ